MHWLNTFATALGALLWCLLAAAIFGYGMAGLPERPKFAALSVAVSLLMVALFLTTLFEYQVR